MLLAKAGMDATVASLARCFEFDCKINLGATGFSLPVPPEQQGESLEHIALAVCGAHMSGLPLNAQLTNLDASFVTAAKTAAKYKFYALAGGPPLRPGLIRSNHAGASIVLEIWPLPKAAMGCFLEGIPALLGIGSIELSDGNWVKGFLCETSGLYGATDILHLADWRKFLSETV
ncbi:hypothetical protein N9C75_01870 [Alphaproteobacteria bacterium]|nr:hypothetical protein [Alphaproteobacteria bacterium]